MRNLSAKFVCLIIILFCGSVFAHDPGMSSINVEFRNEILTIQSDYALREVEKITLTEAQTGIFLLIDGQKIEPTQSNYTFTDQHSISFTQIYQGIKGSQFEIQSTLISKLKPEHKQFFYVRRGDDKSLINEVLTAENNSVKFDFEKIQPNNSFIKFLPIGVEHILFGFDHLLFLFALLLTVKTFGEIVKIVTSFTIAHSITLSLATLNIIQISPTIVEPLIALSIVFVGLENLFKKQTEKRWILTYFFGLIHGFGFATALQEIGIGTGFGVAVPLLSFNLGVEIGQIAVVLLILPILWKLHKVSFYQNRIIPIGSVVVALAGFYWFIERTLF
jgi:hydrogenase/urease accessory protein HupE